MVFENGKGDKRNREWKWNEEGKRGGKRNEVSGIYNGKKWRNRETYTGKTEKSNDSNETNLE